jgi:hypothetical protein
MMPAGWRAGVLFNAACNPPLAYGRWSLLRRREPSPPGDVVAGAFVLIGHEASPPVVTGDNLRRWRRAEQSFSRAFASPLTSLYARSAGAVVHA